MIPISDLQAMKSSMTEQKKMVFFFWFVAWSLFGNQKKKKTRGNKRNWKDELKLKNFQSSIAIWLGEINSNACNSNEIKSKQKIKIRMATSTSPHAFCSKFFFFSKNLWNSPWYKCISDSVILPRFLNKNLF